MKSSGPTHASARRLRKNPPGRNHVRRWIFLCPCLLLAACGPAPRPEPPPAPEPPAASPTPASPSVVSIPEEFRPGATPTPVKSVLPRVVFATSDFQVTTQHGIQGISAGDALNFIRQSGEDYFVEYRGVQFKRNKSYFASTYVKPAPPQPTPSPVEEPAQQAVAETSAEPLLPDEPPQKRPAQPLSPKLLAEQKKVGGLTDSIRDLNDKIRAAQEDLDRKSAQAGGANNVTAADLKKAARAIQRLKAQRDALSGELTEIGKP